MRQAPKETQQFKVGDYMADYSSLTPEEIAQPDPELDALFARSRPIKAKRWLRKWWSRQKSGTACPVCGWDYSPGIRDEGCFFPEYNCPRTKIRL